jgi:hypothetical protein
MKYQKELNLSVGLCRHSLATNGSPDLRGFGAGVAKLRAAEKSRKCADVSRSRPHLRMQSGDPMWRRMAPHRLCINAGALRLRLCFVIGRNYLLLFYYKCF